MEIAKAEKTFEGSTSGRVIGSEFFMKINSLKWGPSSRYPRVECALIKAQLACKKTVDNICKGLTVNSIHYMLRDGNRSNVAYAERCMHMAREIVQKMDMDDKSFVHVAKLDVRLALFLCGRQSEFGGGDYRAVHEIAQAR